MSGEVNDLAGQLAENAMRICTPPKQVFIVIVGDPEVCAYRTNAAGGVATLPSLLRDLASKIERTGSA